MVPSLRDFLLTQFLSFEGKDGIRYHVSWDLVKRNYSTTEGIIVQSWDFYDIDSVRPSYVLNSSLFEGLSDGTWYLKGGLLTRKLKQGPDFGKILSPGTYTSDQIMEAIRVYSNRLRSSFSARD